MCPSLLASRNAREAHRVPGPPSESSLVVTSRHERVARRRFECLSPSNSARQAANAPDISYVVPHGTPVATDRSLEVTDHVVEDGAGLSPLLGLRMDAAFVSVKVRHRTLLPSGTITSDVGSAGKQRRCATSSYTSSSHATLSWPRRRSVCYRQTGTSPTRQKESGSETLASDPRH